MSALKQNQLYTNRLHHRKLMPKLLIPRLDHHQNSVLSCACLQKQILQCLSAQQFLECRLLHLRLHRATNLPTVEMKRSGISSMGMWPQSWYTSKSAPNNAASFWLFHRGTSASLSP